MSSGRRQKEPQASGKSLEVVKKLHHVISHGIVASHDVKHTASRLLKTVKPDLTEAHVLFKLIKAAS